jgi:hypothetical protein
MIFVASPDDVAEERATLENVVRELNMTWGSTLGVHLDLVAWTTHAHPGMGVDAQAVINQQIGDEYDIFVGIMWTRFGSPTGRAGSGTEEEFGRALERYRADTTSVKIMFYFKDESVQPSLLDLSQYQRVRSFKERLGTEGALYWNFTADFESFLRLHLAREIQAWLRNATGGGRSSFADPGMADSAPTQPPQGNAPPEEDDRGLLDYMEAFTSHFTRLNESQARLTATLEDLGTRVHERTAEQNKANVNHPGDFGLMKGVANGLAQDMLHFVSRTEVELPIFGAEMQETMQSFSMALTLACDFGPGVFGDLAELRVSVRKMADTLEGSTTSTASFRQTIATSPRLTTEYNRAKRRTVDVLDRLTDQLKTGSSLLMQVLRAIDGLAGSAA